MKKYFRNISSLVERSFILILLIPSKFDQITWYYINPFTHPVWIGEMPGHVERRPRQKWCPHVTWNDNKSKGSISGLRRKSALWTRHQRSPASHDGPMRWPSTQSPIIEPVNILWSAPQGEKENRQHPSPSMDLWPIQTIISGTCDNNLYRRKPPKSKRANSHTI